MLTGTNEGGVTPAVGVFQGGYSTAGADGPGETKGGPLSRVLRVDWLGQTAASLFWIASVFVYGISSAGDWLQLGAASAWLIANIAAVATAD